jgi:hypothetical protein
LAIFGFNLCASVFLGLCVYGLLIYSEGAKRPAASPLLTVLVGMGVLGCIAGICYFGRQWDRRNAEEAADRKSSPAR